jgi:hypothetical protein
MLIFPSRSMVDRLIDNSPHSFDATNLPKAMNALNTTLFLEVNPWVK